MLRTPLRFAALIAALFLILAGCGEAPPAAAPPAPAAKTSSAASTDAGHGSTGPVLAPCSTLRKCKDCPNDTFTETNCLTTAYGPARANVITVKNGGAPQNATNMLRCQGGDYALCFYSGPPDKSGINPNNNALPCTVDKGGDTASCTCQAYTGGDYYVDIHAISNLNVYYQTVDACGYEGERCVNLANCQAGTDCDTHEYRVAPVCDLVKNQTAAGGPTALLPHAQIVSTFSFVMTKDYTPGATECPDPNDDPANADFLYAGCMTAGCVYPGGVRPSGDLNGQEVQCSCPLWRGPYQVGQGGQSCTIPPSAQDATRYVWSAAYTVTPGLCSQK